MNNNMKLMGIKILSITFFMLLMLNAEAQVAISDNGIMYLNKNDGSPSVNKDFKRGAYVGPHVLGDTITMLMNKLEHDYTYYKPSGGAYSTDVLVINKGPIYKAVRKVNRHFEKQIKKGKMSEEEAYPRLKALLLTAIKLYDYHTAEVEENLKDLKNPVEIEAYINTLKFR